MAVIETTAPNRSGQRRQKKELRTIRKVSRGLRLLALVSATQIAFLIKADKTARIAADAAKKSAEVAERALIAGQRPFVSVTAPIIDGGLTWEEKGARTTILFSIKNVGKSPAFDISVQADQFVMGRDKPHVNTELRKFCAAVRRQKLLPLAKGDVLFPNETLPQRHGLLFIRAEIETNAKCNWAFFAPIVLICVDYRSRHTTGLVYDLFQWTTEGAKLVPMGEAVQAPFLSLARSPEGSFAD